THYKKLFCEDHIDTFDAYLEFGDDSSEPIIIKDMIDFTAATWKKVTPKTIQLDQINEHDITSKIQDLIMRLPLEQPMSVNKYLIADNDLITTKMPNDKEIIEAMNQQPDGNFNVDVSLIQNLEKIKKDVRLKHITSQHQATLNSLISRLNSQLNTCTRIFVDRYKEMSKSYTEADSSKLLVKRLSEKAKLPERASPQAAGYDLFSAVEMVVPAKGKALVPTDISIALPEGTYGRVAPRSGLGDIFYKNPLRIT
ncbi:24540_t:CDS:2, partial [Dentiscutata erythropus]